MIVFNFEVQFLQLVRHEVHLRDNQGHITPLAWRRRFRGGVPVPAAPSDAEVALHGGEHIFGVGGEHAVFLMEIAIACCSAIAFRQSSLARRMAAKRVA